MILQDELWLLAEKVEVEAFSSIISLTGHLHKEAGEFSGPKMDAAIRKEFSPEFAEKLVGKDHHADVYDEPNVVDGVYNTGTIDPGFVLFGEGIDWEENRLQLDWLDERILSFDWFFPRQDYVGSELESPTYKVKFSALSFEVRKIELLLPSMKIDHGADRPNPTRVNHAVGRPRKWDWEGVLAHITAQAQTPDGLPTGHGAQARIEGMMAEWFEQENGASPAMSQIR